MQPSDPPAETGAGDMAPTLVVFCGMTASGKSTLASAWAEQCGAPCWNTDRVRKELVGLRATDRRPDAVGEGIYTSGLSAQTYLVMLERARTSLAQGAPLVMLDGSYSRRQDRNAVREMAREAGASCAVVLCVCSEEETHSRLARRLRDTEAVSDGRWEIYQHQQRTFEWPDQEVEADCLILDTTGQQIEVLLAWLASRPWDKDKG